MKTKTSVLCASLALFSVSVLAQESSITSELALATKFVDRGLQLGDTTFHAAIEYSQNDVYGGIWSAIPLENTGAPDFFEDEYDFYGGYGWALNEGTALDVGATYYYLPDGESTFEAYVGIYAELGSVTPSLYLYNDFDLDTTTIEAILDVDLPQLVVPVDFRLFGGQVEIDGGGDYSYYGADVVYPLEVGDQMSLDLGLHYVDNSIGAIVSDNNLFGSATFTVTF